MVKKSDIVRFCRKLYEKGFVVANDGNISTRIRDGFYITATGSYFAEITEAQIVRLEKDGIQIGRKYSEIKPSSELAMHLEVYRRREEIKAVIHAHAPYSTAFSLSGISKIDCPLTEIEHSFREIPIAPFAEPGTPELAESIRALVERNDAIILSNHGVLTLGKSLEEAYWNLERVEHFARICYLSKTLGRGNG